MGKLIAHSKVTPIVLPFYHRGMDNVVPEIQLTDPKSRKKKPAKPKSIIPQTGNNVGVFVGSPIDFTSKIEKFKLSHPDALTSWQATKESLGLYHEIADELREAVLTLQRDADKQSSTSRLT